jgi:hypothetical protein
LLLRSAEIQPLFIDLQLSTSHHLTPHHTTHNSSHHNILPRTHPPCKPQHNTTLSHTTHLITTLSHTPTQLHYHSTPVMVTTPTQNTPTQIHYHSPMVNLFTTIHSNARIILSKSIRDYQYIASPEPLCYLQIILRCSIGNKSTVYYRQLI